MYKQLSILIIHFTLLSCSTSGQVESESYDKFLGTLLSHTVNEVSVQQAASMQDNVVFLDAREPREYEISHIKPAMLVGYDHFDINTIKNIPKDSKIIVYCSVGYRSEKIAEKLIKDGFTDVSNLYGGIFEWKNEGFDVYNDSSITEEVHAYSKTFGIWLREGQKVYK